MIFCSLLLALLFDSGKGKEPYRTVDVLEINHRYDEFGRHCYTQVIAWNWMPDYRRYRALGFVLVDGRSVTEWPQKSGEYYWLRRDLSYPIRLKSKILIETWTDFDPERESSALNSDSVNRMVGGLR